MARLGISFTFYPRRGSRSISDIPPRRLCFTNLSQLWGILKMWLLVSPTLSKRCLFQVLVLVILSRLLRHPWREVRVLFFCSVFVVSICLPHKTYLYIKNLKQVHLPVIQAFLEVRRATLRHAKAFSLYRSKVILNK
jgi:hypothetical protein